MSTHDFEEQLRAANLVNMRYYPYIRSPGIDNFIVRFLFAYLKVINGCSIESLQAFTVYDYINFPEKSYDNWIVFEDFIAVLMKIYVHHIRADWVRVNEESENRFVMSPCGRYRYLSGIFFVVHTGFKYPHRIGNPTIDKPFFIVPDLRRQERQRRPRIVSARHLRSEQTTKDFILKKCMLQQWSGIDVMENCPDGRGRGLIASKRFHQHEVLLDYHAKLISRGEANEIEDTSYLFCAPKYDLFWDGSAEFCECHPQSRLLGRLANFAAKNTPECNATPQLFSINSRSRKQKPFYAIVLVASRQIEPLEEIRFDYGDRACLALFRN